MRTARLFLRPFTLNDAPFVLALTNDPAWLRFIGDKGVRDLPTARRYIVDNPLASYARHGFGLYAVEKNSDGRLLGMCGLIQREALPHPDLGFAFLEEFRGQGFACEAANAVLEFGARHCSLQRILALTLPENTRCIRLLQRLAFQHERQIRLQPQGAELGLYARAL